VHLLRVKGFNLFQDWPLLAGIPLQAAYFSVLLNVYSFGDVIAIIDRKARPGSRLDLSSAERAKLDKLYRAVTFYLRKACRSERPCLRRSLILYRWCIRRGIEARIVIGVRKGGGELESHAWLEINGQPFREKQAYLAEYTPILES
jgi:hypothetical protein